MFFDEEKMDIKVVLNCFETNDVDGLNCIYKKSIERLKSYNIYASESEVGAGLSTMLDNELEYFVPSHLKKKMLDKDIKVIR